VRRPSATTLSAVADANASTASAASSASGNVEDQPKQQTDLVKLASASSGRDLNHASALRDEFRLDGRPHRYGDMDELFGHAGDAR
jgi:hypothetical protein